MADEAFPHVSLALHPGHQAKDLGPMVKRLQNSTDWQSTGLPNVLYSPSGEGYAISIKTVNQSVLQHSQVTRHHGRELEDHPLTEELIGVLPDSLWSSSPTDVGSVSCPDIEFDLTDGNPLWVPQYPHKPAAVEGIADTIHGLLEAGVLELSSSKWNTPILPVEKKGTGKWRMAHDLRRINARLVTKTIPVPNPYTALSTLTPDQSWFTCIDLANAFFCLPLHPRCRDIFSFMYKGCQYRYTRVPQGFALSPGLFNGVLKEVLADCPLPSGTTLIQYVDDLLLASPTAEDCLTATRAVLEILARAGFKVSKAKLQCARKQVSFLGRLVSQKGVHISPEHRSSILHHPKPLTVKDMLSFLGLTGYSRTYIPDYTSTTQPLRDMVKQLGMRNLMAQLEWTEAAERAFILLKQSLSSAADLSTPDYSSPFYLDVSVTGSSANGVLFQKKGGVRFVIMYVSVLLDNMETRHPTCTQHVAAMAKLIEKTAHIVMGHTLIVLTTHSVVAYVTSALFTMTPLRQRRLCKVLEAPNISYTHEGINMADHITQGEPHKCMERIVRDDKVREDLAATPFDEAVNLFVDGCCFKHWDEGLQSAYAVVKEEDGTWETVEASRIEGAQSAQRAEVLAIIAALRWGTDQRINIYSDSAYAVGAAQVELGRWERAGFRTADNRPIKYEKEMRDLALALHLPAQVAIIKCKGHDKSAGKVALGNQKADEAAKTAAGYIPTQMIVQAETDRYEWGQEQLKIMQEKASPQEKTLWVNRGGKDHEGIWRAPDGRVILPPGIRQQLLEQAHGVGHVGVAQMMRNLGQWWHPYLKDMAQHVIQYCEQCRDFNPKRTVHPEAGKFPLDTQPGREIIIDYTDMIDRVQGYRYLLVCVDAFTGWPEAIPTRKEDSKSVIKFLINHYIPRHGFPQKVRSDNGTHFKNKDLEEVENMLGLKHKFGTVYHPQSQGKVERMNANIKTKLAKICAQTKMTWVDALPLALMAIRSSVNTGHGLTPYELQTGRLFPGPQNAPYLMDTDKYKLGQKAYFAELQSLVSAYSKQVGDSTDRRTPTPQTEWVLLRVIKRKWSEPRWTGPHRITERTSHAVRLHGKGDTWYHWSQCAPTDPPQRSVPQIRLDLAQLRTSDLSPQQGAE
ncbi:uncharacterized protein LOC133458765 [Cololabis saira]|uniref:uncharacterized protein LOC133458765 n=1 Tax=Cololabis saira TaxID=129043 RepID=UPI002AD23099|nr:uncharacterized protein LOC133458765 [Cololabis saira]